jgi:hypothetical protein
MKTFFLTMAKNIGQAVFTVVFISSAVFVYAAWNTPVKNGDTLTSTLWNDLVTKVAQLDTALNNKADKSQLNSYATVATTNSLQTALNSKADRSYVDTKVAQSSGGVSCRSGFVSLKLIGNQYICIQKGRNAAGKTIAQAKQYCADTYGGRIVTQEEYSRACSLGVLNDTGTIWEMSDSLFYNSHQSFGGVVIGQGSCSASSSSYNHRTNGINIPSRCVY